MKLDELRKLGSQQLDSFTEYVVKGENVTMFEHNGNENYYETKKYNIPGLKKIRMVKESLEARAE